MALQRKKLQDYKFKNKNATLRHKNIEKTHILVRNQNFEKQKSGIPKYRNRTYFFWNP
jgi:hypothetical protein